MLSRFYNGDSAIHGLSPMSKIIGLFIVLILVLFNHDLFSSLFLAIFVCGLVLMSKIPVKLYLRGVLSYGPFLILLFLILFSCTDFCASSYSCLLLRMIPLWRHMSDT